MSAAMEAIRLLRRHKEEMRTDAMIADSLPTGDNRDEFIGRTLQKHVEMVDAVLGVLVPGDVRINVVADRAAVDAKIRELIRQVDEMLDGGKP